MKGNIKKSIIIFLVLLVLTSPLFAEAAKVTFVYGKVEVLRQDENWYELSVGDEVEEAETITTGFSSEVKLEYRELKFTLGSLTRLKVEKLFTPEDDENISFNLNVGALRSRANFGKENKNAFVVKTPAGVCSTGNGDFTVTAKGDVTCHEGQVIVYQNRRVAPKAVRPVLDDDFDEDFADDFEDDELEESEENSDEMDTELEAADDETDSENSLSEEKAAPAKKKRFIIPAGAIVLRKSHSVSINNVGVIETPMVNASKKAQQAKNIVSTINVQEAEVAGSSAVTDEVSAVLSLED